MRIKLSHFVKVGDTPGGAGFWIIGGEDESVKSRKKHGAGAHHAWFESHGHFELRESIILLLSGGIPECINFGVSGGVTVTNHAIFAFTNDNVLLIDNGADGDFAGEGGTLGKSERVLHGEHVIFGEVVIHKKYPVE